MSPLRRSIHWDTEGKRLGMEGPCDCTYRENPSGICTYTISSRAVDLDEVEGGVSNERRTLLRAQHNSLDE